MKKLLILLLFAPFVLNAQTPVDSTQLFKEQYGKIYKAYSQQPENVALLVEMAQFYAHPSNPMQSLSQAIQYALRAEKNYVALVEDKNSYREVSKLVRKKITVVSVRQLKQDIINQERALLVDSKEELSSVELDEMAKAFSFDPSTIKLLERRRLNQAYSKAKNTASLRNCYSFLKTYPGTTESDTVEQILSHTLAQKLATLTSDYSVDTLMAPYQDSPFMMRLATKHKSKLAYSQVQKQNTPKAYKNFLSRYPGSDEYVDALEALEGLLEEELSNLHDPQRLVSFAQENNDSPLGQKAVEKLRQMITQEEDQLAMKLYLEHFPLDEHHNELYRLFYEWHAQEGCLEPIQRFAKEHPDFPYTAVLRENLAAAQKIDSINLMQVFDESMFSRYQMNIYKMTARPVSYVALQRIIQQQVAQKNWNAALARVNKFSEICFETDCVSQRSELQRLLSAPIDRKKVLTTEVMPSYNMLNPILHPNGNILYFTKKTNGRSTVSMAQKAVGKNYRWIGIGDVKFENLENKDLEIYCLFNNGTAMLLGHNGDILEARLVNNQWHVWNPAPEPLNTPYVERDAFMLPNGEGMLFVSDRPNGHNFQTSRTYFHGDTALASDIYYVARTPNGWGIPVNLGITINTPYCELSPVMSQDMKTLYFITDARGLGYGDVYYSTRLDMNSWTSWSTPENLGKEINTGFHEASLSISADDRVLFLSSNPSGRYFGCFSTPVLHEPRNCNHSLGLNLKNLNQEVAPSIVSVVDCNLDELVFQTENITPSSRIATSLYEGKKYVVVTECNTHWIPSQKVFLSQDVQIPLEAYSLNDLRRKDIEFPLHTIGFSDGKITFPLSSEWEFNNLEVFLLANPGVKVEVTVQVPIPDVREAFALSVECGNEIRNYLINRGISNDRITVLNYGNYFYLKGGFTSPVKVRFVVE